MRSSSSGGSRRSRSARKAFVVSLIVSLVIVGGATALGVTSGGRDYGPDIKRLYDQVADLQQQNQRLEEALNRTREGGGVA